MKEREKEWEGNWEKREQQLEEEEKENERTSPVCLFSDWLGACDAPGERSAVGAESSCTSEVGRGAREGDCGKAIEHGR